MIQYFECRSSHLNMVYDSMMDCITFDNENVYMEEISLHELKKGGEIYFSESNNFKKLIEIGQCTFGKLCVMLSVMQKWVKVYLTKVMKNLKRCKNNMEHIVSMKFTIS